MQTPLFQRLSSLLMQRGSCDANGNVKWFEKTSLHIEALIEEHLPHGSGFDNGTKLDWDRSTPEKLVFDTSFHHMDENGYYCGWSEHTVTVRPSLFDKFTLSVSGRNMRDIKPYIHDVFYFALRHNVTDNITS